MVVIVLGERCRSPRPRRRFLSVGKRGGGTCLFWCLPHRWRGRGRGWEEKYSRRFRRTENGSRKWMLLNPIQKQLQRGCTRDVCFPRGSDRRGRPLTVGGGMTIMASWGGGKRSGGGRRLSRESMGGRNGRREIGSPPSSSMRWCLSAVFFFFFFFVFVFFWYGRVGEMGVTRGSISPLPFSPLQRVQ